MSSGPTIKDIKEMMDSRMGVTARLDPLALDVATLFVVDQLKKRTAQYERGKLLGIDNPFWLDPQFLVQDAVTAYQQVIEFQQGAKRRSHESPSP